MRLTDWLERVDPSALYPEDIFEELRQFGIAYKTGMLTSTRMDERPYPSFGRCSHVPLMTERELAQAALKLGKSLELDTKDNDVLLTPGYMIITAVWGLFRPLTVGESPPSSLGRTPEEKALFDLDALRRYGY